jgi:hypothetical protein
MQDMHEETIKSLTKERDKLFKQLKTMKDGHAKEETALEKINVTRFNNLDTMFSGYDLDINQAI